MMFNPFHKRRRHKRNPKRRHAKRRGFRMNPVRRGRYYRRNPLSTFNNLLPQVASGAVGAVAVNLIPGFLGTVRGGIPFYGLQAAIIVGGGWAVDEFFGKGSGDGWIIGSAAVALTGVVNQLLNSLGITTYSGSLAGSSMAAFPSVGAYPDEVTQNYTGNGEYYTY